MRRSKNRHFHSLIGHHDCLLFFDIDAKQTEMLAAGVDHDRVRQMSMPAIVTFIKDYYGRDVVSTNFYCAEADGKDTASWHLHIHLRMSADEREQLRCNLIEAKQIDPRLQFVDASPYTSMCSIRCIGSSKVGSDRVLKRCKLCKSGLACSSSMTNRSSQRRAASVSENRTTGVLICRTTRPFSAAHRN